MRVANAENVSERDSASEAISGALTVVLGRGHGIDTLHVIEQRFHLGLEQILDHPDRFVEALTEIFGPNIASVLARLILRELKKQPWHDGGQQFSRVTNFENCLIKA